MNVLFVCKNRYQSAPFRDESTRYRCYHMAEGIHAAGFLADVTTLASLNSAHLSRYDVVSIHQPTASPKLLKILQECNKHNIKTVADLDALEFDPTLAADSPHMHAQSSSLARVRATFMRQSLALKHFDEVSVATEALARARRAVAPNQTVYVAANGLSNYWLTCNDHVHPHTVGRRHRMGYFSNSMNMSMDFLSAMQGLRTFMQNSKNRELFAVGPLEISSTHIPESQLVRGAWVDFMDKPQALANCWVNLAPLKHSPASYAQPYTNFIEAAAFGVPTISSPTEELLQHDVPGLIIANDEDEWLQALEMLSDKHFHSKCQKALYEYSRDKCLATQSANNLIRQWSVNDEQPDNESITRLSAAS